MVCIPLPLPLLSMFQFAPSSPCLSPALAHMPSCLPACSDAHALLQHQKGEVDAELEGVRATLSKAQDELAAAEVRPGEKGRNYCQGS